MNKPNTAAKSLEARKIDLAILEAQDAIRADPNNWEAHYNLASIYFSQKEYKLAEEIFLKILAAGNKSYAVYRGLGNVFYAQKNYREAAKYLEKAVDLKYKDPESHYDLALVYYKLNQEELFVQECTRALVVDKNFARAHYSMGFYYAQQKKYDQAIKELVKAIKISPADPEAHFLLMKIYLKKGEEKGAMEQCVETLKYNPKHIAAHYQQGLFAEKYEDYAMAVKEFVEVKRLAPDYPNIPEKIANTLKKEEEKYYQEIKKKPTDLKPYLSLADLYYEVGRLDLAAEKCEEVLALDKNNIIAHSNLGVIYASVEKYIKAIVEYKKALAVDPDNRSVQENLKLAFRLGIKYYRKLLENDKDDINAWDSLILIYREQEDYISVIDVYEEKTENIKDSAKAKKEYALFGKMFLKESLAMMKLDNQKVYRVGLAYLAQNDLDAAEQVFKIILENNPKNVQSLYLMGRVLSKKNNIAQALGYFQKAYHLNPSYRDTYIQIKNICLKEVEDLKKKLMENPEDVKSIKSMAEIYEAQQLYEEAINYYKKLCVLEPNNQDYQNKYKNIYESLITQLARQVDQASLDLNAYLSLGELYEQDAQLSKSISVYDRGLKLFPQEKELLERKFKASQKAVEQFERYLEKDPNNVEVLFALAAFAVSVGYHLKAINALARAIELKSSIAERAKISLDFKDLRTNAKFQELVQVKADRGTVDQVIE
ncbi:MAG: tetratricopeptide repeat protein [Candidatus Margulisbacteria bacterium]|nr:tetratricopeptide repeat protein [Candidatus Margulisiibacteriota bacterium]